jgi:DNA-binding PadR family transcriptional regulator
MAGTRLTNPLALAVLVLLFERPMHPYEMSTTLRTRRKQDSIKLNYGSLYSVVASLEKYGLIEVKESVREGNRPERTVYQLTPAGEAKATGWLSELLSTPAKEYTRFEAALSLIGAIEPDDAIRQLELRLGTLILQQRADDGIRSALPADFPRIFVIEGEYQRALLDAEVAFVRKLIADLKSENLTGIKQWRRMHELHAAGATAEEIADELSAMTPDMTDWLEDPTTSTP